MAALALRSGQTVETADGRRGNIRYIGPLHIAAGEWCGLELSDASGKNDGSVKGERYFDCEPGFGIFVRKESVVKIVKQATPAAVVPKVNGAAPRPSAVGTAKRMSTVATADTARKRQSLMSSGSGSQAGSRLSTRSPTKSPMKATNSSASSATSTPRTMTPATTARTSDSSTKSRLSLAGRPPVAPPVTKPRVTGSATRTSISGTAATSKTAKPLGPTHRSSLSASKLSTSNTTGLKRQSLTKQLPSQEEVPRSPTIDEEHEDRTLPSIDAQLNQDQPSGNHEHSEEQDALREDPPLPPMQSTRSSRTASASRPNAIGTAEARAAQQKELEQLRVKLRSLEKKREEDRDKLKQVDNLQADKDRFENIIQALQKKLKANQEELKELRKRCEEAESKANDVPDRSAEIESELELANLDKEMAEERADTLQAELSALKSKAEELELETEVLREENRELSSTMSPEERASAGFLHLERESERLREALILLKDISQQTEADLKIEVKELQSNLEEAEDTASKYFETIEKLSRAEETNQHLMEQLEAAESNEEVVEAMEQQRERQMSQIQDLRRQVRELEEHVQVTDELENFHVEEEKRLLSQLDEQEAMLNDRERQSTEQERVIEDLEYTLSKFRNVVQGLQSDIDEARRSREISELQAHEMSSKSRAMMDLNLQLQNNAAKSQTKLVDIEMGKVKAKLATKQVEILSLFLPESFETDRNPVLVYLAFGRLRSKTGLIARMLSERLRERNHLSSSEEILMCHEIVEIFQWLEGMSDRFERFMSSCSPTEFAAFSNAIAELDPIDRTATNWLEALRRDELGSDEPEHLRRMQGILVDLAEKTMVDSAEAKANELVIRSKMIENYSESSASMIAWLAKFVQLKLGSPKDDDEESIFFDKKADQLGTKVRTIRYLCSKITQELDRLRSGSMCIGETLWSIFEDAEDRAMSISKQIREISASVTQDASRVEREEPLSYLSVMDTMNTSLADNDSENDAFSVLITNASSLQSIADSLGNKASDLSSAIEFEPQPAPWTIRAREIKSTKIVSSEIQDQLDNLQRRNNELVSRIADKERTIEEMTIRVELAEKRVKENRLKDQADKALKEEIERLTLDKRNVEHEVLQMKDSLATTKAQMEKDAQELEVLRQAAGTDSSVIRELGVGKVDETVTKHMSATIKSLETEIVSMQSTLRFLREENRALQVPVTMLRLRSAQDAWLDPSHLQIRRKTTASREQTSAESLRRQAADVHDGLIEVAQTLTPVRLKARKRHSPIKQEKQPGHTTSDEQITDSSSWRPVRETTRYEVLRQREEIEKWSSWRDDLAKQARLLAHGGSLQNKGRTVNKTKLVRPGVHGLSVDQIAAPKEGNTTMLEVVES